MKNDEADNIIDKPLIKSSNLFPVVGIGASAGGLDAFKKLLKAIPENSGMAYVLVQHLHPEHESFLADLLQKVTKVPVLEISDDIKVEPNHIYIIPSNKMLIANDGKLELSPRPAKSKNKLNLPIDLFFTSLAEIHQTHAIGVVLSGTGSDGTLGLQAIKDNGGITFAQNIASANYDSMPAHAIQADVVDFILLPEEMPKKLLELVEQINLTDDEIKNFPLQDEELFKQILSLLRIRKGTDFTYYKQTTIRRRILRRMAINKNEEPTAYLKYLKENKPEQDALYQDLLIPVTSFFRDSKIFDNLCQSVFPTIVKNKLPAAPVRLWVAACSTGQEAYSMAICLKEFLGNSQVRAQIFATDISEPAIAKARAGIYTKAELEEVSDQRLREFFTKSNGGYRLNKDIRDMCVFAVHNFIKDPPFGKIDFISCRNVLIYMEPYLQKKALTTFHYALNPKGFLLLGKSETSSSVPDLFLVASKNDKLFTRKDVPGRFMHVATQRSEKNLNELNSNLIKENMQTDFQKTADEIMLSKYTPAGVVVNEAMDIVHFRGNTNMYLEQAPGKPTHNLLKMAKNGLAFELRNILHKAKKENSSVIKENIPIQVNGVQRIITIEAMPLPNVVEPHYLILFHGNEFTQNTKQLSSDPQTSSKLKKDEKDLYIQQIEKELAQTREDMRSITEDQEAANEELQSANEELLSGSEELQSLNEELETSKEELQSSNEELTVVNQELISLNEQITNAQQYAESIVDTVREPLLVLDKNLRVKTANRAFYKLFHVNDTETEGNLIYNLGNSQWDIPSLRTLLEEILPQQQTFTDFEVAHHFPFIGEKILLLNAREIKGEAGAEKLILLVMEDVTEQKKYQLQDDEFLGRFKNILLQSSMGVAVYKGMRFHVEMANEKFLEIAGIHEKDFVGKSLFEAMPERRAISEPLLMKVFKTGIPYNGNEVEYINNSFGKTKKGFYNFTYQAMYDKDGNITGIMCVVNDVTEQVNARKKVEENENRFRNLVEKAPSPICIFRGEDMILETANKPLYKIFNVNEQALGKSFLEILPEMRDQPFIGWLQNVYKSGTPHYGNEEPAYFIRENGIKEILYFNFVYQPYHDKDGTISGVMVQANNVTDLVVARKKMEAQAGMVEELILTAPAIMCTYMGPTHIYTLINERYQALFGNRILKGKTLTEALPELEGQGFDKLLDGVYKTGESYVGIDVPVTIARDEGATPQLSYFNFSYQAIYNEHKEINGVLLFGYEVTEQVIARNKNLETEQSHSKELEEKVQQRTLELIDANELLSAINIEKEKRAAELIIANKKLLHESTEKENRSAELAIANKELQFQNEEKEKRSNELSIANKELLAFNYISSHDLQEPLRKIQTFASLIAEKELAVLSAKGKDYFHRIEDSAKRMQTLIEDLLAYSRTNVTDRNFEKIHLNKIVEEVIYEMKESLLQKNATVELKDICEANVIPFQMRQVMNNLITNAIKFTTTGVAPHIIITCKIDKGGNFSKEIELLSEEKLSARKEYCRITFKDNGIGFDPQYKHKIFEVFQRLHGKETYAGTGIGLAIVKKIVQNHNGIITADGKLNEGATFSIYLPVL